MKITNVESFIVDAGWRPWTFVKVETDEGVTGYGECSVSRGPLAVTGAVEDLKPLLLGADPRAYEMRFFDLSRHATAAGSGLNFNSDCVKKRGPGPLPRSIVKYLCLTPLFIIMARLINEC